MTNRMTDETAPAAVLIVAAGRGHRAGGGLPKQFRQIGGEPVLRRTVARILALPFVGCVQIVRHPDDDALVRMALDGLPADKIAPVVDGGDSRQASVLAGLRALAAAPPRRVLIHDAVRPFASAALFASVLAALDGAPGAIAALPVSDTLKKGGADGRIAATVDRAGLWGAQTPQGFDFATLLAAHEAAAAQARTDFTDDASLLEWRGEPVVLVPGEPDNFKITQPEDFARADRVLGAARPEIRTGIGYDVHAFTDGDHVTLGGIAIPHGRGVLAHSDGDVILHALVDALLGALGDGDIGRHFPPSDPQWRNAPSDRFLAFAAARVRDAGGRILHLDVTVVAEEPRVGPHRDAMRAAIAAAAGVDPARVSIKATTSERMGFTGRREGLAALAAATVEVPGGQP